MKTAGLVLDFYDDMTGSILKDVCPSPDRLPEAVKTAHILSPAERDVLRDEAYALILHNDGQQLRKFACVDEGNTVLSTLYFMETFHQLPTEAVKTAAQNLIAFNEEFGLPAPTMLKMAAETGMARKRDSMKQPLVGDEADWAARTNLVSVRGGADSGRVIPTANQMKTAAIKKKKDEGPSYAKGMGIGAGVGGALGLGAGGIDHYMTRRNQANIIQRHLTTVAPEAREATKKMLHGVAHSPEVNRKLRNNYLLGGAAGILGGASIGHSIIQRQRQKKEMAKVSNLVDVSALTPEPVVLNKTASRHALGDQFALDSFSDVQDAIRYFDESWTAMAPENRHEFAVKTASRADELGIEVPEIMARYGSTGYSPDIEAHLANRRAVAPQFSEVWDDLQEKRAMIEPEQFAELLKEADELVGLNFEWGGSVMDPYFATFGGRSETEKLAWAWQGADGDKIDEAGLRGIDQQKLAETFSPDFVEAFQHDPVTIFESMPDQHKVLISRMV